MHITPIKHALGLSALCAALLMAGCNSQPPMAGPPPADRSFQAFWGKRVTGYITAADGTELRYSVLLPKGEGTFPVLVRYSGYDSGSIGGSAYLADNETFSVAMDKDLVERGYAVMGVQARGTGCSQGTFDFLGPQYGTDGRSAVEFAAQQSWSTGSVGMFGWSWAGMSQLMTATERPKGLKAIAPGMILGDPRSDSWAPGGVPNQEFTTTWHWFVDMRWDAVKASAETEKDHRCLAQVEANKAKVVSSSLMYNLIRHPLRDEWTKQREPRNRANEVQVPVLSMQSWQDEAVLAREGYYQERLDPKLLWMVQSSGGHNLYESEHFRKEKLYPFLDHFVKGEQNGFESSKRVEIWQETVADVREGRHQPNETAHPGWTIERDHYPLAVKPVSFALSEDGELIEGGKGSGKPDAYLYPIPGPDVNTYLKDNAWGWQHPLWKQGSLAYTSAPFERDLLSYGTASADIWLSTFLAPDADVQVTITEVRPDDKEVFVQRGWLRMSNRKLDESKSSELRPWLVDEPDAIQPMLPNVPALGRVEIPPFSHPFRKGSKLRIWIDAPSRTGGYGFAYYALQSRNSVYHDAQHPSRLVLGELPGVTVPPALPACDTLLKQPCRHNPLSAFSRPL